jgi:putative DNA methylase
MGERRKLIEVALPTEEISEASRRDKDRKTGTIRNAHKWFAPMPPPAWRALLFAALIDDPGDEAERDKLVGLIKRLVPAEKSEPDETTLAEARALLEREYPEGMPAVFDPFCGAGSTVIEAQRLGLPAVASDLNPVPALITRTLTQLVPAVAGHLPLHAPDGQLATVPAGQYDGLSTDVRHYAERVRELVWAQVGHLYPQGPAGETVIAWLWARTVTCPNPACGATAPLATSFWLSKKKHTAAWIEPSVASDRRSIEFHVRTGDGQPPEPPKSGRGGNFRCLVCNGVIEERHVQAEGKAGRIGVQLMAMAAERNGASRVYLDPDPKQAAVGDQVERPDDAPDVEQTDYARWFSSPGYGFTAIADLFTNRQLVMLGAFADAVAQVPSWVRADGGDQSSAVAITSILGLCLGKLAGSHSTQGRFEPASKTSNGGIHPAFSRQALPMVWDFAEMNPFAAGGAQWLGLLDAVCRAACSLQRSQPAEVFQADARRAARDLRAPVLVATDPPYFDQIGYADLSDYFYVWHRRALRHVHPDLYATMATPKADELIAAPYRHDGRKDKARQFFIDGFTETFRALAGKSRPDLPMLVIYAHRQEESKAGDIYSTGWDAILEALIAAGLSVLRTWPIHGTTSTRQIGLGTNALASYLCLVCRPRPASAGRIDQAEFLTALRAKLPSQLRDLQRVNIPPVDLSQASLGPGLEVFSSFSRVELPDGTPMPVRTALGLINRVLDEVLAEQEGELDPETRWAITWFEQHGFDVGPYGEADGLARGKDTAVNALVDSGIVTARADRVALIPRDRLPDDWDPESDRRISVWEVTLHLIKALERGGVDRAGNLLRRAGWRGTAAHDLAYRMYQLCQDKKWAGDAQTFNNLVTSWPAIVAASRRGEQPALQGGDDGDELP